MAIVHITLCQEQDPSPIKSQLDVYNDEVQKVIYVPDHISQKLQESFADANQLDVLSFDDFEEHSKFYREKRKTHMVIGVVLECDYNPRLLREWSKFFTGLFRHSALWEYHIVTRKIQVFEELKKSMKNCRGVHFNVDTNEPTQEEAPHVPEMSMTEESPITVFVGEDQDRLSPIMTRLNTLVDQRTMSTHRETPKPIVVIDVHHPNFTVHQLLMRLQSENAVEFTNYNTFANSMNADCRGYSTPRDIFMFAPPEDFVVNILMGMSAQPRDTYWIEQKVNPLSTYPDLEHKPFLVVEDLTAEKEHFQEPSMNTPKAFGWHQDLPVNPWGQVRQATPFTGTSNTKPNLIEYTGGSFRQYREELIRTRFHNSMSQSPFHATIMVFNTAASRHRFVSQEVREHNIPGHCLLWNELVDRLRGTGHAAGWSLPKNETVYLMDPDLPDPVQAFKAMGLPNHRLPHSVVCYNYDTSHHPSVLEVFGHHGIINLNPQEEVSPLEKERAHIPTEERRAYIYGTYLQNSDETSQYEEWILDNPDVVKEARERFPDPVPVTHHAFYMLVSGKEVEVPLEIHGVTQDSEDMVANHYDHHITLAFFDFCQSIDIPLEQSFGGDEVVLEKIRIDVSPHGRSEPVGTYYLIMGGKTLAVRFR